ncbi:MAG: flavohemoglobin expression-modulating QEGLA motif protein, partial [Candidatus Roizmanbacteria bacterium]|nr:flavohemoglobin expression-modulating QEGLA motif protein [Candidatus Roizmanbacteria bacterium]
YERGDEGVATMREQSLEDKMDDFADLGRHLAISLAYGLDGINRDFRAVYGIVEKQFLLEELLSGKDYQAALSTAQTLAWNRAVRTFRGTQCRAGACFTKDIIYSEGNIATWIVMRENPDELFRLNVGKYDPANNRHLWVLDQLGISDQDIEVS